MAAKKTRATARKTTTVRKAAKKAASAGKVTVTFSVPKDAASAKVLDSARKAAKARGISFSAYIRAALERENRTGKGKTARK